MDVRGYVVGGGVGGGGGWWWGGGIRATFRPKHGVLDFSKFSFLKI